MVRRFDRKLVKAYRNAQKRRRATRWADELYAGFDARESGLSSRRALIVHGMRRSGNHAVINWILSNSERPTLFLNCVRPAHHANPLLSCGQVEWANDDAHGVIEPEDDRKGHKAREVHLAMPSMALLVVSYAAPPLAGPHLDELAANWDRWLGPSDTTGSVLILRDPFNLFASRLHKYGAVPQRIVDGWKAHARAWGELQADEDDTTTTINYNRWCVDHDYRSELATRLGLADWRRGADRVSGIGGGSSFDGTRFHGDAGQMRTDERWKRLAADPRFTSLFDDEVIELSRRVFGPMPEPEARLAAPAVAVRR